MTESAPRFLINKFLTRQATCKLCGGLSAVSRAVDETNGRCCALKCLRRSGSRPEMLTNEVATKAHRRITRKKRKESMRPVFGFLTLFQ